MSQSTPITGAQALVSTFAEQGVTACFANPGTSEMHMVTALDREPRIHSVLCLFEGVASGAADGFARMSGQPALTQLHLGCGYLNAASNNHNARRAYSPIINVIGDHATYHRKFDAPLTSDIEAMAAPNSTWVGVADNPEQVGNCAVQAWQASMQAPRGPVSLLLPADIAWSAGGKIAPPVAEPKRIVTASRDIEETAKAIKSANNPAVLISGTALSEHGLQFAARIKATGVRVMHDLMFPIMARGAGRFVPDRMQYFAEMVVNDLAAIDLFVVVGTRSPVAFFAYPNKPSDLSPEKGNTISLGGMEVDSARTLADLADALDANAVEQITQQLQLACPTGSLDALKVGLSVARHLPEAAFVSDDGVTSSMGTWVNTVAAAPHDWMPLTGGALGQGLPAALGAAIACPSRKGLCLLGDGAAMYTNQALWSIARESCDVVIVVFVNRAYRILDIELAGTGAGKPGKVAQSLLNLGDPDVDWVALSRSMGVPAVNAHDAQSFDQALVRGFAAEGPQLIAAYID